MFLDRLLSDTKNSNNMADYEVVVLKLNYPYS